MSSHALYKLFILTLNSYVSEDTYSYVFNSLLKHWFKVLYLRLCRKLRQLECLRLIIMIDVDVGTQ